MSISED